jgi:hypothetical protein
MAKQPAEYKNCDNSKTNILQYIDVYIRILNAKIASYLQQASNRAQMDRPDVRRFYEQTAPESASWWCPTQLQIQPCNRRKKK